MKVSVDNTVRAEAAAMGNAPVKYDPTMLNSDRAVPIAFHMVALVGSALPSAQLADEVQRVRRENE